MWLRPAVDFSSLEAVLVVVTPPVRRKRTRPPMRVGTRVKAPGPDCDRAGARAADHPGAVPRGRHAALDLVLVVGRLRGADERAGERDAGRQRRRHDSGRCRAA